MATWSKPLPSNHVVPGSPGHPKMHNQLVDALVEVRWNVDGVADGEQGPVGPAGPEGEKGDPGASAYEVAISEGYQGTESEWLASLVGPEGPQGEPGVGSSAAITVTDWMAQKPFRAAHRGGGGEGPEHTLIAYTTSVAQGAQAIEVSCQLTADNVLVCWHDTTLTRMTNGAFTGSVSDYTYYQLKEQIKIQPQGLLGDGWSNVEITRVTDVLDRFLGQVVILIEAKTNDAVVPLENLLASYPLNLVQDSVIWKGFFQTTPGWAGSNGLTTWGYVNADTTDTQMDAESSKWSFWGVPHTMSDQRMLDVLNRPDGKDVMCWEVHRYSDIERLSDLQGTGAKRAIDGYMIPQWGYLNTSLPVLVGGTWTTKVKAPGDLGVKNYDPDYALKYDDDGAYVPYTERYMAALVGSRSYLNPPSSYRISWKMMFPEVSTSDSLHADIAFCRPDSVYRSQNANQDGGMHAIVRFNGGMKIYKHDPGVTAGIGLSDEVSTEAVVAGQWMSFEMDVTPTTITMRRTDTTTPYEVSVTDASYRGGFVHLSNGSVDSAATVPRWDDLSITPL